MTTPFLPLPAAAAPLVLAAVVAAVVAAVLPAALPAAAVLPPAAVLPAATLAAAVEWPLVTGVAAVVVAVLPAVPAFVVRAVAGAPGRAAVVGVVEACVAGFVGAGRAATAVGCMPAVVELPAFTWRNVHAALVVANAVRCAAEGGATAVVRPGVAVGFAVSVAVAVVGVVIGAVVRAGATGNVVGRAGGTSVAFAPVAATGGVTVVRAMRSLNEGAVACPGPAVCRGAAVDRGAVGAVRAVGAVAAVRVETCGTGLVVAITGRADGLMDFAAVVVGGAGFVPAVEGRVGAAAWSGVERTTVGGTTGFDEPPATTPVIVRGFWAVVGPVGRVVAVVVVAMVGFAGVTVVVVVAAAVGVVFRAAVGGKAVRLGATTGFTFHAFCASMIGGCKFLRIGAIVAAGVAAVVAAGLVAVVAAGFVAVAVGAFMGLLVHG